MTTKARANQANETSEVTQADQRRDERPYDDQAALRELHAAEPLGTPTMALALGDDVWRRWVEEIRTNPAYHLRDPDDPTDVGMTGSSGPNPPPPVIVEYGPGANQYIATTFDSGQAMVVDAADPTGKTWKFPESAWRRFVARVRGEKLEDGEEEPQGPTIYEAAAEQNARTAKMVERDRQATPDNKANK